MSTTKIRDKWLSHQIWGNFRRSSLWPSTQNALLSEQLLSTEGLTFQTSPKTLMANLLLYKFIYLENYYYFQKQQTRVKRKYYSLPDQQCFFQCYKRALVHDCWS